MAVYCLGLAVMFGTSALFHLVTWGLRGRRRMRRADHSTIFLGIAGSYTAIGTVGLTGTNRVVLLCLAWGGAVIGVTVRQLFIDAPKWANAIPYVVVGWSAMIFVAPLIATLGVLGFLGILCGGLAYTAGALFYAAKRPNLVPGVFGYHELFHALTVVGAAFHMAVVWTALN
jgi:hemolysin III